MAVSSIGIVTVLFALTLMFGQAQTKPDWCYWRTSQLEINLGFLDKYIDITSVRGTGNVWEFNQISKNYPGRNNKATAKFE